MAKNDATTFKRRLAEAEAKGNIGIAQLLSDEPDEIASMLAKDTVMLARILAAAAATAASGNLRAGDASAISNALVRNPALLARLITGTGA
jgi:hypothetical protein